MDMNHKPVLLSDNLNIEKNECLRASLTLWTLELNENHLKGFKVLDYW